MKALKRLLMQLAHPEIRKELDMIRPLTTNEIHEVSGGPLFIPVVVAFGKGVAAGAAAATKSKVVLGLGAAGVAAGVSAAQGDGDSDGGGE